MRKGLVIKSAGKHCTVLGEDGSTIACTVKGRFRIEGFTSTNPVAVGDRVEYELTGTPPAGVIHKVLGRKNFIIRKSSNFSKNFQIIAANIDQAFLLVTVTRPKTFTEFIDRFLVMAEAYDVPVIILFNKTDLCNREELNTLNELFNIYDSIGYSCRRISALSREEVRDIKNLFRNRISLISGNSGVGKTTLINNLEPGLDLRTAEISEYHQKGRHITATAEMFPMSNGGYLIDTPGIKAFGILDMENEQIDHFFPEIFRYSRNCRYHNCTHIDEPGCAVKEAVRKSKVAPSRYKSYLSIAEEKKRADKYR